MKYSQWIGLLAALALAAACYMPWINVPSANLQIGGMAATGPHNFGRPGLLHIFLAIPAAAFYLLPFVWAKRTNIFVCGLNMAWAMRNYFLLNRCYGGDCPTLQPALYVILAASALMLLATLFANARIKERPEE